MDLAGLPESPMCIITLTWDAETHEARLDIGEMDEFSAYTLLCKAAERIYHELDDVLLGDEEEDEEQGTVEEP